MMSNGSKVTVYDSSLCDSYKTDLITIVKEQEDHQKMYYRYSRLNDTSMNKDKWVFNREYARYKARRQRNKIFKTSRKLFGDNSVAGLSEMTPKFTDSELLDFCIRALYCIFAIATPYATFKTNKDKINNVKLEEQNPANIRGNIRELLVQALLDTPDDKSEGVNSFEKMVETDPVTNIQYIIITMKLDAGKNKLLIIKMRFGAVKSSSMFSSTSGYRIVSMGMKVYNPTETLTPASNMEVEMTYPDEYFNSISESEILHENNNNGTAQIDSLDDIDNVELKSMTGMTAGYSGLEGRKRRKTRRKNKKYSKRRGSRRYR